MPLLNDLQTLVRRLGPRGWQPLFQQHGLDLDSADLDAELTRPLPGINRSVVGFEDFSATGQSGIEPGDPARSLLYHGLASPSVVGLNDYPTFAELNTVENFIWSRATRSAADVDELEIAVFAYQYRPADATSHGAHADFVYSRTGFARVGTHPANYVPERRAFWPVSRTGGVAVSPARYGVFLCKRSEGNSGHSVLGVDEGDERREFLVPMHKLFDGEECLTDANLDLAWWEEHANEKLRRVHTSPLPNAVPPFPGFDLDAAPFVRRSSTSGDLVRLDTSAGMAIVSPLVPADGRVTQIARQHNVDTGRTEIARFVVPASSNSPGNRFWTSYELGSSRGFRPGPEYVNIRQRVTDPAGDDSSVEDLNQLSEFEFDRLMSDGGYEAAHFADNTADGALGVNVSGLGPTLLRGRAAFSIVSAPDFFPLIDQTEIQAWVDTLPDRHFAAGGPSPLSRLRDVGPNPELRDPDGASAFPPDGADATICAVIGTGGRSVIAPRVSNGERGISYLPDAASNVFAPGWDLTLGLQNGQSFLHGYGLGSPFPEDAKLCAALNSFWPAVAPDSGRTFGLDSTPTAIPLTDRELGLHSEHPLVVGGFEPSSLGWDGLHGPFLQQLGNGTLWVNAADVDRADLTRASLDGNLRVDGLAAITTEELIRRMEALRACMAELPVHNQMTPESKLWLVHMLIDQVDGVDMYRFYFAFRLPEARPEPTDELGRVRIRAHSVWECRAPAPIRVRQIFGS